MWFFLVLGWVISFLVYLHARRKWSDYEFERLLNNFAGFYGGFYVLTLVLSGVISLVLVGFGVFEIKPHPDPIEHWMMAFTASILTTWIAKFRLKQLQRPGLLISLLISQVSIYTLLVVLRTLF